MEPFELAPLGPLRADRLTFSFQFHLPACTRLQAVTALAIHSYLSLHTTNLEVKSTKSLLMSSCHSETPAPSPMPHRPAAAPSAGSPRRYQPTTRSL